MQTDNKLTDKQTSIETSHQEPVEQTDNPEDDLVIIADRVYSLVVCLQPTAHRWKKNKIKKIKYGGGATAATNDGEKWKKLLEARVS